MTQETALSILKTGANVFLTGEPGAGKTYVLNQYTDWLLRSDVAIAITASTGIAATHIGGMTIHSWSGIGIRETLSRYDLDYIAGREPTVKRIRKAKVLVIDEISMLDGRTFDMVEVVCRTVRERDDAFGGLQIVVVGDFFQLPPIARNGEMARFAYESNAWDRARFITCYLKEQHRQEDEALLNLLSAIRMNDVSDEHYELLKEQTAIAYKHIEPTRLFTHNSDVDAINATELARVSGNVTRYTMTHRGSKQLCENLAKNCMSPGVLEVKIGAMVMCTKNNFEAGYVNGTLGRVVSYDHEDGFPIIETSEGSTITIRPASWAIEEDGKLRAEITQVPLRLAWAITIHKSQGMSLDAAEIDLRNAFTFGQGYVALSRVRSLAGMKLIGLNDRALLVDPRVVQKDERFKESSEDAEAHMGSLDAEEISLMHKQCILGMGGKWKDVDSVEDKNSSRTWLKKEHTLQLTKELIRSGLAPDAVAKKRELALTTIWGHVEKLIDQGELSKDDVSLLVPKDTQWIKTYKELQNAFATHGTERLKPIYDALGERYDYNAIRLGRILYMLK